MKKTLIITIFLIVLAIVSAFYLQQKIMPLTDALVQSKTQYIGNKLINDSVTKVIAEEEIDDIFVLQKDENGKIISEKTDIVAMNLLKSKLASELNESFNNIGGSSFHLPLGNIIGFDLLSTYGPRFYVKLLFYGSVEVDFENEFYAAGINQTKHVYYVNVKAQVRAIVSGRIITCQIENKIPIAEIIILGDVPQVFLNNALPR